MAWLKLTSLDDTKTILNIDKIIGIVIEDYVVIVCEGNNRATVKESLEEIEAMLNGTKQHLSEEERYPSRDYIGSDKPTTSRDFGKD